MINPSGATINCINIQNNFTVTGSVSNAGTITATGAAIPTQTGITINNSSVGGGISNSGTITAVNVGILVGTNSFVPNNAILTGGITNSGTISITGSALTAAGILITNVASASGAISNTGTILGGAGISLQSMTAFHGDIANSGTITSGQNKDAISVGGVSTFIGNVSNTGTLAAGGFGFGIGMSVGQFSGNVANSGRITAPSGFGISVDATTFTGNITNSGIISVGSTGMDAAGMDTFTGNISNSGTVSASLAGMTLTAITTFNGGVSNSGVISAQDGLSIVNVASFGGNISNSGTISASTIGIFIGFGVTFGPGSAIVNSGTIIGGIDSIDLKPATSAVTIDQVGGLISGAIKLSPNADVLNVSGGAIAGNIVGQGSSNTINFNLGGGTFTYDAAYGFSAVNQANINSGLVVLNGANSATNVDVYGGTLAGSGSITPTNALTIHSGGTFAPGTPGVAGTVTTINGNLAFQSGAIYLVNISPTTASRANVSGSVTLNGTVEAVLAPGSYNSKITYTILDPSSISGTFTGFNVVNAPGVSGTLSYLSNDGFLNLTANLGANATLTATQQSIANIVNTTFNSGGTLPAGSFALFQASGATLPYLLSQLSGEAATDAEKGANQLMTDFLNLMLDPSAGGGGGINGGGARGFAPEQDSTLPLDVAQAYASALKAPPASQTFNQRWSAWGSAFGGTGHTNGDPAIGTNNVSASDYGFAAGMDYHATPDLVYGFGLAGGGTNWNLAQGLGSGRSDAFQAGIYAKTHLGPAYLSAALAFANHWFTTDRTALGDQLRASFTGQSYAARLETGYRYALPVTGAIIGVTPYAALQAQDFHTPSYGETDLTGGGFGLNYASMNATDTRSELGARFDNLQIADGMPLVLRGRLAWAHDWISNPSLGAAFQTLPGAIFTVNGATPPKNSALTTAAAELHVTANWTAIAKFDGEFGSGSETYGGTGTLRYTW